MERNCKIGDVISSSRLNAKNAKKDAYYIVVQTAFDGGGFGHGPHDVYPDGHHVWVKKLNRDGSYNDNARTTEFYQSGAFTGMIMPEEIELHETRKRVVDFDDTPATLVETLLANVDNEKISDKDFRRFVSDSIGKRFVSAD